MFPPLQSLIAADRTIVAFVLNSVGPPAHLSVLTSPTDLLAILNISFPYFSSVLFSARGLSSGRGGEVKRVSDQALDACIVDTRWSGFGDRITIEPWSEAKKYPNHARIIQSTCAT